MVVESDVLKLNSPCEPGCTICPQEYTYSNANYTQQCCQEGIKDNGWNPPKAGQGIIICISTEPVKGAAVSSGDKLFDWVTDLLGWPMWNTSNPKIWWWPEYIDLEDN